MINKSAFMQELDRLRSQNRLLRIYILIMFIAVIGLAIKVI